MMRRIAVVAAVALAAAVDAFIEAWRPMSESDDSPYPLRWMIGALVVLDQPVGYEAMARCLLHDNPTIADPVMRSAPVHESLVPGMVHILSTGNTWMQNTAEKWLQAFPDQAVVDRARAAAEAE